MNVSMVEEVKPSALEAAKELETHFCIADLAKALEISWSTARQVLMELLIEGEVETIKTSKSRVFTIKQQ